ncbi:signal peptidase I [Candidatus Gottesmanbacteria bacterium RIFCSPHIGHO2_02_FULL_39_11]|uniref:Signal peptidase I n=1 Tax=Candidatus Gottesmanbacteria bacterium RIFCSPHIGHO2_02_FULL_39_11 TaxID=1798382 RepID=A0A1F5ZKA6_9BACT|nr:MAG: signal peptidase I [Candidatus Gottesmanbacteria bacterium RIFCSPHIGHO2_02_FULL_39_11]
MAPSFPKGTGSTDAERSDEIVAYAEMYPYPGGILLGAKRFFAYQIKHGDIVEIKNNKTDQITKEKYGESSGFVKRVIGLPGDTVEFRDGFVYRNGSLLDEPYIAKPRSTYGGDIISECEKVVIPSEDTLVLGDNRKASLDSRYDLGLIRISDIHYVLPYENQTEYRAVWRDSSEDSDLADTPALDSKEFVRLLNDKRKEKNLSSLKPDVNLARSSKIRGEAMITSNDFSIEATKSGESLKKSLSDANYKNITFAEVYSKGYYQASELIDNLFEFPNTTKLLLSEEYQDVGVDTAIGKINGCPSQVVVVHLGGYIPPNYTKDEIDSWYKLMNQLDEVLPSWENVLNADGVDKDKVNQIISLIKDRRDAAEKIYNRMKENEYLTDEERILLQEDTNKGKQLQSLISEMIH